METKKCTKCGVEKEVNEYNFCRHKRMKNGFEIQCKKCKTAYSKAYNKVHKLQRNSQLRDRYKFDDEYKKKVKKRHSDYQKKNRIKKNAYDRVYTQKARDELADHHVRAQIKASSKGLTSKDITPELIETKRLLTFIKRELKKLENGKSEKHQ